MEKRVNIPSHLIFRFVFYNFSSTNNISCHSERSEESPCNYIQIPPIVGMTKRRGYETIFRFDAACAG